MQFLWRTLKSFKFIYLSFASKNVKSKDILALKKHQNQPSMCNCTM